MSLDKVDLRNLPDELKLSIFEKFYETYTEVHEVEKFEISEDYNEVIIDGGDDIYSIAEAIEYMARVL